MGEIYVIYNAGKVLKSATNSHKRTQLNSAEKLAGKEVSIGKHFAGERKNIVTARKNPQQIPDNSRTNQKLQREEKYAKKKESQRRNNARSLNNLRCRKPTA